MLLVLWDSPNIGDAPSCDHSPTLDEVFMIEASRFLNEQRFVFGS